MKIFLLFLISIFLFSHLAEAHSERQFPWLAQIQGSQVKPPYLLAQAKKKRRRKSRRSKKSRYRISRSSQLLVKAKKLAAKGKQEEASSLLFSLTRSSAYRKDSSQVKYILGLILMKMELYQVASFIFYDIISGEVKSGKTTKYLKKSIEKLSFLSNILDSNILLKYAISRIKVKDFPSKEKDLFFYRLGELRLKEQKFRKAAKIFNRVNPRSLVYPKALYKMGLAYSELKKGNKAISAFKRLLQSSQGRGVTDSNRVSALISIARIYYQNKKWDAAIEYYRRIPRDTWLWHEALFEQSWAMLRSGKYFRSALSNFHTLHSSYYDDHYSPESLLLRGMVYLFICRYDEMDKTLNLFERIYKPVSSRVNRFIGTASTSSYLDEITKGDMNHELLRDKEAPKYRTRLPTIILNEMIDRPNIRRNLNYLKALEKEKKNMNQLSIAWRASGLGRYTKRVIDKRINSTRIILGKQAKVQLRQIKRELRGFFEQGDFLKFEMLSGAKENLKKEIVGKKVSKKQITDQETRSFFVKNGFEYWPYQGEYWLDELGNYHYVGFRLVNKIFLKK